VTAIAEPDGPGTFPAEVPFGPIRSIQTRASTPHGPLRSGLYPGASNSHARERENCIRSRVICLPDSEIPTPGGVAPFACFALYLVVELI
jgi:hypothetical protein